jgi:hypothetical protein
MDISPRTVAAVGWAKCSSDGYTAAARYLDNSEEMVREAYSHIDAGEQADVATAALAESDQRVSNTDADE